MILSRFMSATLFIFAHQDDEFAMASRIRFEAGRGSEVHCAYLTSGVDSGGSPRRREAEALAALTSLGVDSKNVHFIGSELGNAHNSLSAHLDRSLAALKSKLEKVPVSDIYCLAWEGGHSDHDASHLAALAFAKDRALLNRTWQFFFYNGEGAPWKFFRVLKPLSATRNLMTRPVGLPESLRILFLCFKYRSQWKSWAGLFPQACLSLLLNRREVFAPVRLDSIWEKPHQGVLLYEKMFKVEHEFFVKQTSSFRQRFLKS